MESCKIRSIQRTHDLNIRVLVDKKRVDVDQSEHHGAACTAFQVEVLIALEAGASEWWTWPVKLQA